MEKKQFISRKKYSEGSGVIPAVDSNIRMELDEYGLYHEVVSKTVQSVSDLIEDVSPNLNAKTNESFVANSIYSNECGIQFDSRIGYYLNNYIGHVIESDYRKQASSGGIATWILKELWDKSYIDYVIHVKKNSDESSNILFKYDISSSIDEIRDGAKTKYYPVELSEVIEIVRKTPGRYAIVGIPSFIYSIRLLAEVDSLIKERIKYTVGLICGHQKSTKFAEAMAWQLGIKPGDLKDIDFRYKYPDKPASQYGIRVQGLVDGKMKTIITPKSALFGQNWGWGFFKPISSNFSDDVFNETADIVVGDAWLSPYNQDGKGNNIIITRSAVVDELISQGIKDKKLKLDKVNAEKIFESQASHYRHTHDELAYRLYKQMINKNWYPTKRVEPSIKINKSRKKIQDLREEISSQSHLVYKKAVEKNDINYFFDEMSNLTNKYNKIYKIMALKNKLKKVIKF